MGTSDDETGIGITYYPFAMRDRSQVFASSAMVMLVVNTALIGLFVGAIVYALGGAIGWAIAVGAVVALVHFVLWMTKGYRSYRQVLGVHVPLRRAAE